MKNSLVIGLKISCFIMFGGMLTTIVQAKSHSYSSPSQTSKTSLQKTSEDGLKKFKHHKKLENSWNYKDDIFEELFNAFNEPYDAFALKDNSFTEKEDLFKDDSVYIFNK